MTRLQHSVRGWIRSAQMSHHDLWLCVEGFTDRAVYSIVCEGNANITSHSYYIALSREIDQGGGSKETLKSLYKQLRRENKLDHVWQSKRTKFVFIVDKDVDDFKRTKLRGNNIIYSDYYTVENYLFCHGDLARAVTAASSIPIAVAKLRFQPQDVWCHSVASAWAEWCIYCVTNAMLTNSTKAYGYLQSKFNATCYAPPDPNTMNSMWQLAQQKSGLSESDFSALRLRCQTYVRGLLIRKEMDKVFSGKWYVEFAFCDATGLSRHIQEKQFKKSLVTALVATLDPSGSWCSHLHIRLSRI